MMARVLVNHQSPMPNKITGISVYTWCILEALVRHGRHEYVLATNWDLDKLPEAIRRLDIPMVRRNTRRNESLAVIENTVALPKLKRRHGCSAIFHPQPTSMLAGMGSSVVVIHDLYRVTHAHLFNLRQRLQWSWITARGFREAGRLLAVSEATRAATVAAYPDIAGRVAVVHEASPIARPAACPPPPPEAKPYGLVVANITPNKNIGLLIEALKLLADRNVRPAVRVVGRDELGVLPSLIGQRSDVDFKLLGSMDDAALLSYYAHAKVYINTSLVEGFCLPILEAHTLGVPVICSDIPVLREVAGDGALFVDPRDAAGLAAAVETLFTDAPAAAALVGAASRNAARFSWKTAALETERLLEAVMSSSNTSPAA